MITGFWKGYFELNSSTLCGGGTVHVFFRARGTVHKSVWRVQVFCGGYELNARYFVGIDDIDVAKEMISVSMRESTEIVT